MKYYVIKTDASVLTWKQGNLFGMLLQPCPSICCENHFSCVYTKWRPLVHKEFTAIKNHWMANEKPWWTRDCSSLYEYFRF